MPYFLRFLWTDENEEHVAAHGVSKGEFEEVILKAPKSAVWRNAKTGNLNVIGTTSAGRTILCAYDDIDEVTCYPVTAYDK
jgi:hypothetical protein